LFERYRGTDPKKQVVEIKDDDGGLKMESIIASGPSDEDPRDDLYLFMWEDYMHHENTWEMNEIVLECWSDLL
jgi:hypothetical protein